MSLITRNDWHPPFVMKHVTEPKNDFGLKIYCCTYCLLGLLCPWSFAEGKRAWKWL